MSLVVVPNCRIYEVWLSLQKCIVLCVGNTDYCNLANSFLDDDFRHKTLLENKVARNKAWNTALCANYFSCTSLQHWVCNGRLLLCTLTQEKVFGRHGLIALPCFVSSMWRMVSIDTMCISTVFVLVAYMAPITVISEHPANSNEFILASLK